MEWVTANTKALTRVRPSDGSGLKPGLGPAWSSEFLESPRPDNGRRAQAQAQPGPVIKSLGAQRALAILLSLKKLALLGKILSKILKSQKQLSFLLHFHYHWYVCLFLNISSILALFINVKLPEVCMKLIFFMVKWFNAEPSKPGKSVRPSPALGSAFWEEPKPRPGPRLTFKACVQPGPNPSPVRPHI